MISRYNGFCKYCHRPTKAGVDQYLVAEKISYHEACLENGAVDEETASDELADKLGFKEHSA